MENLKYASLDMPFSVFLNAWIDGDMSQVEVFPFVFLDFCEAMGGVGLRAKIERCYDCELLKSRVLAATLAIELINILKPDTKKAKHVFESLKQLNYHASVPTAELKNARKYCKQIIGHVNLEKVKLDLLEKDVVKPQAELNKPPTRNDITANLVEICSTFNVHVTISNISAREYAMWINKYQHYLDYIKSTKIKK